MENELYKIAKIRLKNEDDTNEAVQEAIVKAYTSINKLKKEEYFKTWIIRILINECNNIYKKNKKDVGEKYKDSLILQNETNSIDDKISNLDFYTLINYLNYEEQMVITLFYLEEFSSKEIAKILKKPESTIRTRISRARNKIKETLEKGGILYE